MMNSLPTEILFKIFLELDLESIYFSSLVDRKFYSIISDRYFISQYLTKYQKIEIRQSFHGINILVTPFLFKKKYGTQISWYRSYDLNSGIPDNLNSGIPDNLNLLLNSCQDQNHPFIEYIEMLNFKQGMEKIEKFKNDSQNVLIYEINWKYDQKDGVERWWYIPNRFQKEDQSTRLYSHCQWLQGKKNGIEEEFYPFEGRKFRRIWKNGEITSQHFH